MCRYIWAKNINKLICKRIWGGLYIILLYPGQRTHTSTTATSPTCTASALRTTSTSSRAIPRSEARQALLAMAPSDVAGPHRPRMATTPSPSVTPRRCYVPVYTDGLTARGARMIPPLTDAQARGMSQNDAAPTWTLWRRSPRTLDFLPPLHILASTAGRAAICLATCA